MMSQDALKTVYNYILELASQDLQREHWLSGKDGHIAGYVELMCGLFDDNDFDSFIDKETVELNFSNDLT